MRNIIDALTAHAKENQDPSHLTALVRPKLGRLICQPLVDDTGTLTVVTLAPDLEKLLESSRAGAETDHITLDPTLANSMIESLRSEAEKYKRLGWQPRWWCLLLCEAGWRALSESEYLI